MKHISFKQYYEETQKLREAAKGNRRSAVDYSVTKYCKIPIHVSESDEKEYVSLKPKDIVRVLWEYEGDTPKFSKLYLTVLGDSEKKPVWESHKMLEWIQSNCQPKVYE